MLSSFLISSYLLLPPPGGRITGPAGCTGQPPPRCHEECGPELPPCSLLSSFLHTFCYPCRVDGSPARLKNLYRLPLSSLPRVLDSPPDGSNHSSGGEDRQGTAVSLEAAFSIVSECFHQPNGMKTACLKISVSLLPSSRGFVLCRHRQQRAPSPSGFRDQFQEAILILPGKCPGDFLSGTCQFSEGKTILPRLQIDRDPQPPSRAGDLIKRGVVGIL